MATRAAQDRTDWTLVALLYLAGLLAAGQFAKVALLLEPLGVVYPIGAGMLPVLVSLIGLTGILFGATAGVLAAGVGLRKVLLFGLILGALLSLLQALLPPLPVMVGLRLLEGASHLSIVIVAPTLMVRAAVMRDRPVVMGLWGTFFGIGFAGVAAIAPALLVLGGAGALFALHGSALLGLAAVLYPRLPVVPSEPGCGNLWARQIEIYRDIRQILPGLGFLWHALQFLALLTFLPAFLPEGAGVSLPLAALVGTFAAGLLARRWRATRIGAAAFFLSAAGLAGLALLPAAPLWLALATFVLIGLIPGAAFASIPELNMTPEAQARAQGALAQMGNTGTTLGPPLFALTLVGGLPALMVLAVAISLVGGAILAVGASRIR